MLLREENDTTLKILPIHQSTITAFHFSVPIQLNWLNAYSPHLSAIYQYQSIHLVHFHYQ
jgi:hypothetical protein